MIKLIVAVDEKNCIGYKNHLPWKTKSELKVFNKITQNSVLVFGARTFFSLPDDFDTSNREIWVLTYYQPFEIPENKKLRPHRVFFDSGPATAAMLKCDKDIFICGGRFLYLDYWQITKEVYVSVINGTYKCDTYFEYIDKSQLIPENIIHQEAEFTTYKYEHINHER
ncbi:dihydrofolate reductase [Mycoplasma sp. 394]